VTWFEQFTAWFSAELLRVVLCRLLVTVTRALGWKRPTVECLLHLFKCPAIISLIHISAENVRTQLDIRNIFSLSANPDVTQKFFQSTWIFFKIRIGVFHQRESFMYNVISCI